ncbi:hypothetical protein [Stutzerimonas frequens]|uniref:hypothetical protein n=1 Tax=Stutzerimonas frequens TaxID=2968969 RepID=UPI00190C0DB9|nr:hypothetical protein [Stutzerimonas frequens]MBK3757054.1 hypothetical protein [Stutzerimonas frequens]MBK3871664.1 hypothetical protein [Stutzerimonas frequens]MBK3909999.1 hypothetical protein [Stutzerimonas frequens]MBK3928432.1 hypothetical protein [Stutzerimonas frequens]
MNAAIDKLIESSNGRFLTIKFLKDNGEVRTLNGRVGVRWGNVPSSYRRDSKHRKFYLIYVPHKGYRRVNADAVLEVTLDGVTVKNNAVPPEIAA